MCISSPMKHRELHRGCTRIRAQRFSNATIWRRVVDDKVYLISPDYIRATIVEVTDKMKNEVLGYVTVAQLKVAI